MSSREEVEAALSFDPFYGSSVPEHTFMDDYCTTCGLPCDTVILKCDKNTPIYDQMIREVN